LKSRLNRSRSSTAPRALISPTAFKGTLSPVEAARLIAPAFSRRWRVDLLPLADGGDGTLEVLLAVFGGRRRRTRVTGPLGRKVWAEWGVVAGAAGLAGRTAVIEMARASGLALTQGKNRVMEATTRGTGELIAAAMDAGCRNVLIGVGGTATADGGAGALEALGFRFFDARGRRLPPRPADLMRLARVDGSNVHRRLARTRIHVLCDVRNPLLGPRGSARTFGPQKGATPGQVRALEMFLKHWSTFARRQTKSRPGAGAAGATAYGLSAFAGARLEEGCPFVMRAVNWRRRARRAGLIVTGEGRLDATSFSGKVAGEIARQRGSARVAVICGALGADARLLRRAGISAVESLGRGGLVRPRPSLAAAARRLAARLIL
jgi:glycerate 2-kinase